jgi:anti-sigma28 factor (negative regulator of flagellin synthesis)
MVSTITQIFSPQNSQKTNGNSEINNTQNITKNEENRVEAIANALANGTYQIDLDATAIAIAEELRG